ncbi:MAG: helix-turn-helix domain-containing protein [Nitrospira sp.]
MSGPALLRAELEDRGLSPMELAKLLGMKCRTVRDVLRGHQDVRLRDVASVAGALGFSVDLILEERSVLDEMSDPREVKRRRRSRVKWT